MGGDAKRCFRLRRFQRTVRGWLEILTHIHRPKIIYFIWGYSCSDAIDIYRVGTYIVLKFTYATQNSKLLNFGPQIS
jgi:hypothetical protein